MSLETASTPLPHQKQVRDLLSELLGRSVEIKIVGPWSPAPADLSTWGVYATTTEARVVGVAYGDLAASAYVGAAIALVPAGGAQDAVADGALPASLGENFAEVLNIAAALLNDDGAPHVKLVSCYGPSGGVPADVLAYSGVLGRRLDLEITVQGYGRGRFSVVLLP